MSGCITYDIPVSLMDDYRGRKTVVRSCDPSDIVARITVQDLADISYIKLLSLNGEIEGLMAWGGEIPVDLVVSDPYRDLPLLYRYAPLRGSHPIRVSVPLLPGFGNVVKLAVSLNFAVKLEVGQPGESLFDELQRIARFYLHQATVSEPIEFFHSLFLAFYHRDPVTLWSIQEEDPSLVRHVTEQGVETMAGRFSGMEVEEDSIPCLCGLENRSSADASECAGCEFLRNCMGYFKWPLREYRCRGVKELMRTLWSAAEEARADFASYRPPVEGEGP
jgi:hypothetical protein